MSHKDWLENSVLQFTKMREFLIEEKCIDPEIPSKTIVGSIKCPVCEGNIKYSQCSYNGHVRISGDNCTCLGKVYYQE